MRIVIRGVSVIFDTTFYDLDGEPTLPDSATLRVTYPSDGWPLDGSDLVDKTIDLVNDSGFNWTGTWVSTISNPGIVALHARATTGSVLSGQEDSFIRLRGNLANLSYVNA